jgi:ribonuclease Z
MHLNGRSKPLRLFGPPELMEIIDLQLKYSETTLQYPIEFTATHTDKAEVILENQDITVETIPLEHRIACTGFLFKEKKRLRKIVKERIETLNIPVEYFSAIKKGADYTSPEGKLYKNADITINPEEPKTYAYCSDTIYSEAYFPQIRNADLLYHESTFLNNMLDRAQSTFHTTALQAGEVALKTNAKKLLIGHFSARYKTLDELLDEASSVFPETALAIEGRTFIVGN